MDVGGYLIPKKIKPPAKKNPMFSEARTPDGFEAAWRAEKAPSLVVILDTITYWCAFDRFFMVSREENGWTELRASFERLGSETTPGGHVIAIVGGPLGTLIADEITRLSTYDPSKEVRRNITKRISPEIYMRESGPLDNKRYFLCRVNVSLSCTGSGSSMQVKLVVREETIKEGKNAYASENKFWTSFNDHLLLLLQHVVAIGQRVRETASCFHKVMAFKARVTEMDGSKITKNAGIVRYVGMIDGKPGVWVGIEVDKRNDGSVAGKKYFTCAPKKGIFVLPEEIEPE